jgi:hypothetical protein
MLRTVLRPDPFPHRLDLGKPARKTAGFFVLDQQKLNFNENTSHLVSVLL